MKKRILNVVLALILLLQAFIPSLAYAVGENPQDKKTIENEERFSESNLITIGKLKGVGFSKNNPTASISVEKVEQEKNHSKEASNELEFGDEIVPQAVRGTGSQYIDGQQPADSDKPKYWANVKGKLTTVGLDGGSFDWDKVLGKDAKINLLFNQSRGNIMTGVSFMLSIDKDGKYSLFGAERKQDPINPGEYYWVGNDNKPTELPLFDVDGNAYSYNVQTSKSYSENVQLIVSETGGTPGSYFRKDGDKHIATIVFNMSIRQLASTKFVSEWNTSVKEADRPQIEGEIGFDAVDDDGIPFIADNTFNFPKNNETETILRDGFVNNFEEDEENGPWSFLSSEIETTPKFVRLKKDTSGLEFNTRWGKNIVTHGEHIYRYDFNYDVINGGKLTMTEIIPVVFNPNGGEFNDTRIEDKDKANDYTVWVEYGGSVFDEVPKDVVKKDNTFLGWTKYPEYNPYVEPKSSFENIRTKTTFYALFEKDVKEQDQEQIPGRENYPYTMAHFDLTDKAEIRPEVEGEKVKRHFQVWSKNKVTLQVVEPVGKTEQDENGRSFTWKFKYWEEVDGNRKWYVTEENPYVVDQFLKKDTYIKAVFEKDYTSNDEQVETFVTHESKEGINDFLPTFDDLQKQIKIKKGDNFVTIDELEDAEKVKVKYAPGDGYTDFDAEIYDKLQEKENPKENGIEAPTRTETIKAKLTYPDGEVKEVEIPIKVYKNIYEAKTETKRPVYVPKDYVKVTVDPTTKATNPQKTYYYVNPDAKVVIPGEDPTGTGDNVFTKWTMKADSASGDGEDYNLPARHQFTEASTITAQYGIGIIKIKYVDENGDVIPEDKRTGGGEYLKVKQGKLNSLVNKDEAKEFISIAPKFEGYVFDRFYYHPKGSTYTEDGRNTVTYKYYKKVTTEDKSKDSNHYFKVVFDANGGKFHTNPTDKKDIYIYSNKRGIEKDVQVSFEEVRAEVEKTYNTPSKEGSTFKEWQDNATEGSKVEDSKVIEKPSDNTIETFYAAYNVQKLDLTTKKVWDIPDGVTVGEKEYPTMKFTLWRSWQPAEPEQVAEEAVSGAKVVEIDNKNLEAIWKDLPKASPEGYIYTYYVKEEYKNSNIMNDNWITKEMDSSNNTVTNTLKKPADPGTTSDPEKNFVGKLTVKKILENDPVPAPEMAMARMVRIPAANEAIKFKFKVTGPYGYNEEFELEAGAEKELKDLAYGEYTVVETETNDYTPKYVEGEYTKGTSTLSDEPAKVEISKANGEKTVTVVNQNLEKADPNFVTLEATKIWKNGPADDHKEVTIKVFRQVGDEAKKEVIIEAPVKLNVVRDKNDTNKFYYTWTNLPKHDKNGKLYTYSVEEDGVVTDAQTQEKTVTVGGDVDARTYVVTQKANTITNTYVVPQTEDNIIGKKVWVDVPTGTKTPTVKFELWRKTLANPDGEKAVEEAMALTNNQADFGKQDATDKDGNKYIYFVKEVFDNASEEENWIVSGEGTLELTNTYKTKSKPGCETPKILYIPADENMGTVSLSYEELTSNDVTGSTATAKAGYRFVKWIDKNGKEVSREATIKRNTGRSEAYVAMFEKVGNDGGCSSVPGGFIFGPSTPAAPSKPAQPVQEEKTHKAYVKGYPKGDFRPEGKMTRAEAVTIIVRLENYVLGADEGVFSDTKKKDWFNKYVNAAYNKGILEEKAGEKFRPNDPITRGELARLISVIDKSSSAVAPFADVKGHKYERFINQAYGNKRILGYPDGTFRPDADITRAEVTAMINRLYDRKADDKSFDYLANHYDLKKFTDMNLNHWAYYDVMEAANSHRYVRRNLSDDRIVENWKRILVDQVK